MEVLPVGPKGRSELGSFLGRLTGLASAVVVLTYFLAMIITVVLLTSTSIGQDLFSHEGPLVLGAFLIPIYPPARINLLAGFLTLFGIFTLCFAAAAKYNPGFVSSLRQMITPSREKLPNWLVVMPATSSGLLLVVVALTVILGSAGVPTGSLPPLCVPVRVPNCWDPYQMLYTVAYAPPLEETMFRISTIGLLVAFRVLWSTPFAPIRKESTIETVQQPQPNQIPTRGKRSLARLIVLSFLLPEKAKGEAGLHTFRKNGWRGLHWTEWLFLIITSVGFGLAHVLSNVGWDAGKGVTAALSGFVLGLSYLLYGAYASILLHWFFNVYFEVYSLSSLLLGGGFISLELLIGLLAFVAGGIGLVRGIVWLLSGQHHSDETAYIISSTPAQS